VFGIPSVTALAISSKVERAMLSSARPAEAPLEARTEMAPQLQAIRDQLCALTAVARDHAELEETLHHACARLQEWTA
jgi:hypothetical protein